MSFGHAEQAEFYRHVAPDYAPAGAAIRATQGDDLQGLEGVYRTLGVLSLAPRTAPRAAGPIPLSPRALAPSAPAPAASSRFVAAPMSVGTGGGLSRAPLVNYTQNPGPGMLPPSSFGPAAVAIGPGSTEIATVDPSADDASSGAPSSAAPILIGGAALAALLLWL